MLPTEMHSRYILPTLTSLALVIGVSPRPLIRRFYAALSVTTTLNICLTMQWQGDPGFEQVGAEARWMVHNANIDFIVSVAKLALLIWTSY
jgi:hypothetical protein